MRLVSFRHRGRASLGRLENDKVLDYGVSADGTSAIRRLLQSEPAGRQELLGVAPASVLGVDEIEWLPVIPDPGKILCIGLNYHSHREESSRPQLGFPTIFPRYADSQVGHRQPLVIPRETQRFDYEGELAVIIGRPGRRIPPKRALQHVAGYSCYNDGSARDWQRHTSQFMPGKNFPGTGGFGPVLVTPDELADISSLRLLTRVNGQVRQSATLSDLIFDVPELIAYVSTFTPLSVGDVIVTGTPAGVGLYQEPPTFLAAGDEVEVEIEGIGTLVNPVTADTEVTAR